MQLQHFTALIFIPIYLPKGICILQLWPNYVLHFFLSHDRKISFKKVGDEKKEKMFVKFGQKNLCFDKAILTFSIYWLVCA